jgi:hypothetical protein
MSQSPPVLTASATHDIPSCLHRPTLTCKSPSPAAGAPLTTTSCLQNHMAGQRQRDTHHTAARAKQANTAEVSEYLPDASTAIAHVIHSSSSARPSALTPETTHTRLLTTMYTNSSFAPYKTTPQNQNRLVPSNTLQRLSELLTRPDRVPLHQTTSNSETGNRVAVD